MYTLIPHPIQVQQDTLMIAEINDVFLYDHNSYIITNSKNIHSLNDETHLVKNIEPIWDLNQSSCEWECFQGNTTAILFLCNFKKLGTQNGIYLKDTADNRLIYLTKATQVQLDCPAGKIRDVLTGLHIIPFECDITMQGVNWPARLFQKINVETLLTQSPKGDSFSITHLPTYKINDTSPLHSTIKTLIEKLPSEKPFTIKFEEYDLSLEEVQSYSIIAYGAISIMVIINSILIGVIYLTKI